MTSLVQSRLLRPFFNTCAVLPLVRLYAKPSGQRWRFTSRDPAQPALAVWTWDQSEKNGCSASAARQAVGTPPGSCGRLSHRCAAPAVHRLALWSGQSSMAGAITYAASTSIDEITAGSIPVSRGGSIPVSAKALTARLERERHGKWLKRWSPWARSTCNISPLATSASGRGRGQTPTSCTTI